MSSYSDCVGTEGGRTIDVGTGWKNAYESSVTVVVPMIFVPQPILHVGDGLGRVMVGVASQQTSWRGRYSVSVCCVMHCAILPQGVVVSVYGRRTVCV